MHDHKARLQQQQPGELSQDRQVLLDDGPVEKVKVTQEKGMKQVKAYFRDGTVLSMRQGAQEGEVRRQGQDGEVWSETQPFDSLPAFRRGWRISGDPYVQHTLHLWEQTYVSRGQLEQEQMEQQWNQESVEQRLEANSRFLSMLRY